MHRATAITVACLLASAQACEFCVMNVCHDTETIFENLRVTGQMAMDRDHDGHQVLYLNFLDQTTAVNFDGPFTIRSMRGLNIHSPGLAVDRRAHVAYTAARGGLHPVPSGKLHQEAMPGLAYLGEPDLLFYKDFLYYTIKYLTGLHSIENGKSMNFTRLSNCNITDFVVDKNNKIFFVSDDKLYVYHRRWEGPRLVDAKKYTSLSVDRNGDVYFSNAAENAIHKLDEMGNIILYAAYSDGYVGQFVFDMDNNVVFHDPKSDRVAYLTANGTKCFAEPPHQKYTIKHEDNMYSRIAEPSEDEADEGSGEVNMLSPVYKH